MNIAPSRTVPRTKFPWQFPKIETSEIVAVQALAAGTADRQQQLLVWEFMREKLCGAEIMSFWPGGDDGRRASDFAEGKRWVAGALRRIARLRPGSVDPYGPPPPMPGEPED